MPSYLVRVALTYSTTAAATTAVTSVNNALSARGRPERATQAGATVTLAIDDVPSQADAVAVRDALTSAWGVGTRTQGKASVSKT